MTKIMCNKSNISKKKEHCSVAGPKKNRPPANSFLKINRVFDEKKPKNEYSFFSDPGVM